MFAGTPCFTQNPLSVYQDRTICDGVTAFHAAAEQRPQIAGFATAKA